MEVKHPLSGLFPVAPPIQHPPTPHQASVSWYTDRARYWQIRGASAGTNVQGWGTDLRATAGFEDSGSLTHLPALTTNVRALMGAKIRFALWRIVMRRLSIFPRSGFQNFARRRTTAICFYLGPRFFAVVLFGSEPTSLSSAFKGKTQREERIREM
jgi:hypothetical protein